MFRRLFVRLVMSLAAAVGVAQLVAGQQPDPATVGWVQLWPGGRVPYYFDSNISDSDRTAVETAAQAWSTVTEGTVRFVNETDRATRSSPALRIRYWADPAKHGGESSIGRRDAGSTLRMAANLNASTLVHELGHALGLLHEHERFDRSQWLQQPPQPVLPATPTPDQRSGYVAYMKFWYRNFTDDGNLDNDIGLYVCQAGRGLSESRSLPELGNYDYDSVMHYAGVVKGTTRFTDRRGNEFSRFSRMASVPMDQLISPGDASRVLQYYARAFDPNWGFFERLHPSAYMVGAASSVSAVGSPAVAYDGERLHVFARGSDRGLYWKAAGRLWQRLGNGVAGSDPAVISPEPGRIDVVFFGGRTGRLIHTTYANGRWSGWNYVGDEPAPRVFRVRGEPIGPALASRGPGRLDVFVVRPDGRLASRHFERGTWGEWQLAAYDVDGYRVTGRPAALALSDSAIQLAFNGGSTMLYEPTVAMNGSRPVRLRLGQPTASDVLPTSGVALAARGRPTSRYRLVYVQRRGFLAHRTENDDIRLRYIGGLPNLETGPAAVATGPFTAAIVMKGRDMTAANLNWTGPAGHDAQRGAVIEPGGIWLRIFQPRSR